MGQEGMKYTQHFGFFIENRGKQLSQIQLILSNRPYIIIQYLSF